MTRALILFCFALAATACGKQRVVTQPDLPPLAAPAPPPRIIAPPETTEEPPATSPEPDRKPPRRAPAKNEGGREVPAKPEPPKPQPPAGAAPPSQEAQPPTTLQTTPPASQVEMERKARGLIAQARRDLGRLSPASLNADGKGQYDTAKRFVEQAEQALKEQNFVLALNLSDKAATIAAVLVGR
jgi:hypothetical protein